MRCAYVQNFPPQIELITEGEPSDFLHVALSGTVDLFSTWNGHDTSTATVRLIPENLCRAFKALQPYGAIAEGTRITISKQADLERFAKPKPLINDFSN